MKSPWFINAHHPFSVSGKPIVSGQGRRLLNWKVTYLILTTHESKSSFPSSLYCTFPALSLSLLSSPSVDAPSGWSSVMWRIWHHDIYSYDNKRALFVPYPRDAFRTPIDLWTCLVWDVPITFAKI